MQALERSPGDLGCLRSEPNGKPVSWQHTLSAIAVASTVVALTACSHLRPYLRTPEYAPEGEVLERVVLVGDAGEIDADAALLSSLKDLVGQAPDNTVVVFLGDNVYPDGRHLNSGPREDEILQRQIDAVGEGYGLFVPGNHDWHKGGRDSVRNEEAFIKQQVSRDLTFLPEDGCPGPALFANAHHFQVIALDTEWLLQENPDGSGCVPGDLPGIKAKLASLLRAARDKPVVVVAHHPPATHGPHGGFYDWRDHVFPLTRLDGFHWAWLPLPGIGSLYPLVRRYCLDKRQDVFSQPYTRMNAFLDDALKTHTGRAPLIFAGGHDHSLQVLRGEGAVDYVIVSGSGSKLTSVGHGDDTLFAHLHRGFMVMDLYEDNQILLRVVEPGSAAPIYSVWLTPRPR